jgi:hypothetical protein
MSRASYVPSKTSGSGPSVLASVERYDIVTNAWTPVAPLLSPRQDLAAAAIGGKIYVFGGRCRSGRQDRPRRLPLDSPRRLRHGRLTRVGR